MNLSIIMLAISEAVTSISLPFQGKTENSQKEELQNLLKEKFKEYLCADSEIEKQIGETKDRCDVYAETSEYKIIVELDATRADQVAKKMLSRYYYANKVKTEKPTVYVCLLYPGTEKMNQPECVKYMAMGSDVLLAMNPANRFIGAFIERKSVIWKHIE